jgi:hypothetical protein
MNSCYWLLNHTPTEQQRQELLSVYNMEKILFPPKEITSFWRDIPSLPFLPKDQMEMVFHWFDTMDKNDVAVVEGEMTATFSLVSFLWKRGVVVLSSVTERHARETRNGEKVVRSYVFQHICFRAYQKFSLEEG